MQSNCARRLHKRGITQKIKSGKHHNYGIGKYNAEISLIAGGNLSSALRAARGIYEVRVGCSEESMGR